MDLAVLVEAALAAVELEVDGKMNKGTIIGICVAAFFVFVFLSLIGTYNGIVTLEESVDGAWGNVESSYQRRLDLIPNLVSTVQGAADFEQETLTEITEMRSQAVAAQTGFRDATSSGDQRAAIAAGEGVLGRFLAVMENYPTLTATANFRDFQVQLEGTENRISVARDRYNEAVKTYNAKIRRVPGNFIAGIFGFDKKEFFEADEEASSAPEVSFE